MSRVRKTASALVRPFIYPPEVLLSEQFAYGHREIYLDYLGFMPDSLILAEVQHGWAQNLLNIHQFVSGSRAKKRNFRNYPLLVWSEEIASELHMAGMKDVFPIKSPWSLIVEDREKQSKDLRATAVLEQAHSALYFPSHSYPGFDIDLNREKERQIFNEEGFKKITTCLYWLDFIDPSTRRYFAEFSQVECLGFRASSAQEEPWHDNGGRVNFLFELYDLISAHEYVFCDEISTACMAALTLNKKVILLKELTEFRNFTRDGREVFSMVNNIDFLSKNSLRVEKGKLGIELHGNFKMIEIARLGFGFDITLDDSREVLSRFVSRRARFRNYKRK